MQFHREPPILSEQNAFRAEMQPHESCDLEDVRHHTQVYLPSAMLLQVCYCSRGFWSIASHVTPNKKEPSARCIYLHLAHL